MAQNLIGQEGTIYADIARSSKAPPAKKGLTGGFKKYVDFDSEKLIYADLDHSSKVPPASPLQSPGTSSKVAAKKTPPGSPLQSPGTSQHLDSETIYEEVNYGGKVQSERETSFGTKTTSTLKSKTDGPPVISASNNQKKGPCTRLLNSIRKLPLWAKILLAVLAVAFVTGIGALSWCGATDCWSREDKTKVTTYDDDADDNNKNENGNRNENTPDYEVIQPLTTEEGAFPSEEYEDRIGPVPTERLLQTEGNLCGGVGCAVGEECRVVSGGVECVPSRHRAGSDGGSEAIAGASDQSMLIIKGVLIAGILIIVLVALVIMYNKRLEKAAPSDAAGSQRKSSLRKSRKSTLVRKTTAPI